MNKNKNFLITKDVSEYFHLPLRTIQYLSKQGKLKSHKIGGRWLYPKIYIEAYGPKYDEKKKFNFLTAKQVSEYLCIPVRTIRHLSKQGKIKAFKIGNRWRYLKNDIEKYNTSAGNTDFSKEPERKLLSSDPAWQNKIMGVLSECSNRRKYPRINCSLPCSIKVYIPNDKEVTSISKISNISQGGIFIKNHNDNNLISRIKADDPINIKFELNGNTGLEADGRVLRTQDEGLAVKFGKISPNVRELIKEYVG